MLWYRSRQSTGRPLVSRDDVAAEAAGQQPQGKISKGSQFGVQNTTKSGIPVHLAWEFYSYSRKMKFKQMFKSQTAVLQARTAVPFGASLNVSVAVASVLLWNSRLFWDAWGCLPGTLTHVNRHWFPIPQHKIQGQIHAFSQFVNSALHSVGRSMEARTKPCLSGSSN